MYCVVWLFCSEPIERGSNVVQHTSLRMRHGDGLLCPSGHGRREGGKSSGPQPIRYYFMASHSSSPKG